MFPRNREREIERKREGERERERERERGSERKREGEKEKEGERIGKKKVRDSENGITLGEAILGRK